VAAWLAECAEPASAASDPDSEVSSPFASFDAELDKVEADALRGAAPRHLFANASPLLLQICWSIAL
jgi:hypothetical protein